jgi:hypothetical protein
MNSSEAPEEHHDEDNENEQDELIEPTRMKLKVERKRWFSEWVLSHSKRFQDPIFAFIEHTQLLGLIWTFNFGLPYIFYQVTRFTIYLNLDFISSKSNIENAGTVSTFLYPYHAIPFIIIVPLILIFWRISVNRGESIFSRSWLVVERILHAILQLLLLPFFLYTIAFGMCSYSGSGFAFCLKFSPSISILFLVVFVVVTAIIVFFYWKDTFRAARHYSSGFSIGKDEKWTRELSSLELERSLGLGDRYSLRRIHIVSSYSTPAMAMYHLIFKSIMFRILAITLLIAVPSGYEIVQSGLLFLLCLASCLFELLWKGCGWRTIHTAFVYHTMQIANVAALLLIWLRSAGLRSAFLVDSTLGPILITIYSIGWFMCLIVLPITAIIFLKSRWHRWPVDHVSVERVKQSCSELIRDLQQSQLLIESIPSSSWLWSKKKLDTLRYLRDHSLIPYYKQALHDKGNHPLELTLENSISSISRWLYRVEPLASSKEIPQDVMACLKENMDRRQREFALISKKWSNVLIKLVAFNAFKKLFEQCKRSVNDSIPMLVINPPTPIDMQQPETPFTFVPTEILKKQRHEVKQWLKEFEQKYEEQHHRRVSKSHIQLNMPKIYSVYTQYKGIEQELEHRKVTFTPSPIPRAAEIDREEW